MLSLPEHNVFSVQRETQDCMAGSLILQSCHACSRELPYAFMPALNVAQPLQDVEPAIGLVACGRERCSFLLLEPQLYRVAQLVMSAVAISI